MTILVRAKRGETREAALLRVKERHPDEHCIIEGEEEMSGETAGGRMEEILEEYNKDKSKILDAIGNIRKPWSEKVEIARKNIGISNNVNSVMSKDGGILSHSRPIALMGVCERELGKAFVLDDEMNWHIEKYYNIVSNIDESVWSRGTTAGVTYHDCVDFRDPESIINVTTSKSSFCEVRRLGINAGEILGQDMPDADKLARALKFPKLKEGLEPEERRASAAILKQTNMGQNHLTRLVRGVLLVLGAEIVGEKIKLNKDANTMEWLNYGPKAIMTVYQEKKGSAIWCSYPDRERYGSILPHFTGEWKCSGLPERIKSIKIPSDGDKVYVISLGAGKLEDVEVDANELRGALTTYAQSMACEEILDQAYCTGSMLLLHEFWPAFHLPSSICSSDLIRPAMATRHIIESHKRDWNLREAMVVAKYGADVIGLAIKEMMSSGWEHNTEDLSSAIGRIGAGNLGKRNGIYRWLADNITGEASGFIYNVDPFNSMREEVVVNVNKTSMLKYWWLNRVKEVGNGSLCAALLASDYTSIPTSCTDATSARELGFLRQVGVVKNGPLYKREIRLKKVDIDEGSKKTIESCIKEGKVSTMSGRISMQKNKMKEEERKRVKAEKEREKKREQEAQAQEEIKKEEERRKEEEKKKKESSRPGEGQVVAEGSGKFVPKKGRGESMEKDSKERGVLAKEAFRKSKGLKDFGEVKLDTEFIKATIEFDKEEIKRAAELKNKIEEDERKTRERRSQTQEKLVELRKESKNDEEFCSALFETDELAKKSEFWQKQKSEWVRESAFLIKYWRKRKISEEQITELSGLMEAIFPITSLHIGPAGKERKEIVRLVGTIIGILSMGSDQQGPWCKSHFIVQCWGWKVKGRWLSKDHCNMVAGLLGELFEAKKKLRTLDNERWSTWSRGYFGGLIELMGNTETSKMEEDIKSGKGGNFIRETCKWLNLKVPEWQMSDGGVKPERTYLQIIGMGGATPRREIRRDRSEFTEEQRAVCD
ncbi:coat protein [Anthurium mosaic-associated virus]|uniref:Coat protein n=1 Tax=Anthurium mosaic-associated virus TaxID=664255 RepID=D9U544_9VIRU|nr:coat protein [Anthurium mosaic-associated virus]ACU11564.1 coat protein [Anthurium mosaic-associated virus]